jgi:AraC-like DNA-binding protein
MKPSGKRAMETSPSRVPVADGRERPRVFFVEADRHRFAAFSALIGRHADVDAPLGTSEAVEYARHRRYELAVVDVGALGAAAGVLVRLLGSRTPRTPMIVVASPRSATTLSVIPEEAVDAVFSDPAPVGEFLACLSRFIPGLPRRRWSRQVVAVVEDVCQRGLSTISVQQIADRIGASRNHLTHLFHAELGLGVREYLHRVAIASASRLLLETEVKLEGVAAEAGFCDASHLSRVFQRYMDVRPGAFRLDRDGRRRLVG